MRQQCLLNVAFRLASSEHLFKHELQLVGIIFPTFVGELVGLVLEQFLQVIR